MHTMISIATRCDLGWATNCFPLRGGRWGNVASQDLKKALSKKLPSSEPGVPKHYQVRTSARRMFKGSTWSQFHLFLGDIPRGAFHPPPRTRTGVAAYLGFLHHRAGNSLCFSFVWIFCFLDPTPFFLFFLLGLCFYFGGAWEIKFLRLLIGTLMPYSFLIFCMWPDFFLSSLVAFASLHPRCSEIFRWSALVSGGPLIMKLTSFSAKAFAYITCVVIVLPSISLFFWIIC